MTCRYCGHENIDDAIFCNKCGKKLIDSYNGDNKKYRKVHKCPNCGEVLDAFVTKCKTCGYELREIDTVTSLSILTNKLEELNKTSKWWQKGSKEDEMIMLIKNFVIPNTKEDIMELMFMASSSIDSKILNDKYADKFDVELSQVWFSKLEQAYNKAKVSLANDPSFCQIEEIYKSKEEEINNERKKKMDEKKLEYILMILGIVLSFIILMTLIIFGAMGKF